MIQWLRGRGADQSENDPAQATAATVPGRRAQTAARQEASRQRDAERYELVPATPSRVTIPPEKGYAIVPPGELAGADAVVDAANALIDGLGDETLTGGSLGKLKGGFLAKGFLPAEQLTLDSPYLRFALSDDVVNAAASYLGVVPILTEIDVWYSVPPKKEEPRSSQLWHLDHADTTQVKVWVHCSDVESASGPLTVVDAATSDALAQSIDYNFDEGYRVPDDKVDAFVGAGVTPLEGPTGTVSFVDTSRCFHFGSRVQPGAQPRRMVLFQYLTPYAFEFTADHREQAGLRHLANGAGRREQLVLGAA